MKKFAVLFLCLLLIIGGTLPVFAAESVQSWLDSAREETKDKTEEIENDVISRYKASKIYGTYPVRHIKDDLFFEKVLNGVSFSKCISDYYYVGVFADTFLQDSDLVLYEKSIDDSNLFGVADTDHEKFSEFLENTDNKIALGEFGKVSNAELLYYDLEFLVSYGGYDKSKALSLFVWFVHIKSNKGEFLVPYTIFQKGGDGNIFENGKSYKLKDCAKIMRDNVYTENKYIETTNILYPWQIALIAVVGVAAAVGLFFGGKALIEYNQTRRRGGYHHF